MHMCMLTHALSLDQKFHPEPEKCFTTNTLLKLIGPHKTVLDLNKSGVSPEIPFLWKIPTQL